MLAAFISSPPLPSSWNELYLMLGSSSAALIGLLFVATSLHLAEIANEEIYRLRAQYTMLILCSTLIQGTAVLIPQPIAVLGVELLAVNIWGLSFPITLLSKAINISGLTRSWWLFGPPRGGFHRGIPHWDCRSRSRRHRSRVGDVWGDCVLHDFAYHLDMERLDDHAGHWTRGRSCGNDLYSVRLWSKADMCDAQADVR